MSKDVTKMPLIGRVKTIPIELNSSNGTKIVLKGLVYQVVEIIFDAKKKEIFITNKWYKPGVPQVIHSDLVEYYKEY